MPSVKGRRERNKAERRARIVAAARAVFAERGFADATTREIAERADVGVGTLFAYAPDKEALLAMVFGDDLRDVGEAAFAATPAGAPFLDQLEAFFAPRYAFWAADPQLAQHAVKATFAAQYRASAPDPPPQSALRPHLQALVRRAQHTGKLRPAPPELVADAILDVYLSEHRDWVAGSRPDVAAGLARLRTVLQFALSASIL